MSSSSILAVVDWVVDVDSVVFGVVVVLVVVVGAGLAGLGAGVAERSSSQGGMACEVVAGASLGSQV